MCRIADQGNKHHPALAVLVWALTVTLGNKQNPKPLPPPQRITAFHVVWSQADQTKLKTKAGIQHWTAADDEVSLTDLVC